MARRLSRRPQPSADEFVLERREEALGGGVVPAVSSAAHAASDVVRVELPLKVAAHEAVRRQPSTDGHRQRVADELGAHVIGERPSNDAPGEQVDDDAR